MSRPRRHPPRKQRSAKPLEATIRGIRHSRMSGIATLILRNDAKKMVVVPCDYRMTCEALICCFGEVSVIGKRVWYRCDSSGVLETIGPLETKKRPRVSQGVA